MLYKLYYTYGYFCASYPWSVILVFLTFVASVFVMGESLADGTRLCGCEKESSGLEAIIVTTLKCIPILYIFYQFQKLRKFDSKYLLGIAVLFTTLSITMFSITVIKFLRHFAELSAALPMFIALTDLPKVGLLTQFALSSTTQKEVAKNIARGMVIIGPAVTLDTIVKSLTISMGTASGIKILEELSCLACISAVSNYMTFMIFFPACLSAVLQLCQRKTKGQPRWHIGYLTNMLLREEQNKPNAVLQFVKVIMSAGLMLVHAHSHWAFLSSNAIVQDFHSMFSVTSPFQISWMYHLPRWVSVQSKQALVMTLAIILALKYIFFENSGSLVKDTLKKGLLRNNSVLSRSSTKLTPIIPALIVTDACGNEKPVKSSQETNMKDIYGNSFKCISRNPASDSIRSSTSSSKYQMSEESTAPLGMFTIGGDDSDCERSESCELVHQSAQTEETLEDFIRQSKIKKLPRPLDECIKILHSENGAGTLTDDEVLLLIETKHIPPYKLESILDNPERGVAIRRQLISQITNCDSILNGLPYINYDYSLVLGACCENVIGYMPVPVGIAGPLLLDDQQYYVPMATTEGCLVASTNRGCRALKLAGGVKSAVIADGMTRGPVVKLPSAQQAAEVISWLQEDKNFDLIKAAFDSTSRFARLQKIQPRIAGRYLFLRFVSSTGDAMGMNMLSKGTELALKTLKEKFPSLKILSLSGNYCTDKKPAALNWIAGRGKTVTCEAEIPGTVVKDVLKTDVQSVIDVNIGKNLVGSAMAGSIGGFNAQAANIVTAIFIATGQDPAQNVSSSNCITLIEPGGKDQQGLYISCTMPSIEVGTIGGGTVLSPQASCLQLLRVKGCSPETPGQNASILARIICATVMAAELSLISALSAGHLVRSHMKHNRSNISIHSCEIENYISPEEPK